VSCTSPSAQRPTQINLTIRDHVILNNPSTHRSLNPQTLILARRIWAGKITYHYSETRDIRRRNAVVGVVGSDNNDAWDIGKIVPYELESVEDERNGNTRASRKTRNLRTWDFLGHLSWWAGLWITRSLLEDDGELDMDQFFEKLSTLLNTFNYQARSSSWYRTAEHDLCIDSSRDLLGSRVLYRHLELRLKLSLHRQWSNLHLHQNLQSHHLSNRFTHVNVKRPKNLPRDSKDP